MKKSTVALVLAGIALTITSCSYYSCPTYTKKAAPEPLEKLETRYI